MMQGWSVGEYGDSAKNKVFLLFNAFSMKQDFESRVPKLSPMCDWEDRGVVGGAHSRNTRYPILKFK